MNQATKRKAAGRAARPPASAQAVPAEDNFQAPLGSHPDYDDVVDQAIEYSFPCSDPIAVQSCCTRAPRAAPVPRGKR